MKELKDFMPQAQEGADVVLGELSSSPTEIAPDDVIVALKTVHDPELPVNIYDLGLIYAHAIDAYGNVDVTMTLTTPACPVAGQMPHDVAHALKQVAEIGRVRVTLTWDPPWERSMMSEDAQLVLDF